MSEEERNPMDFCCVCEKEIDLCLPHSFDREKMRSMHRECAEGKPQMG